MVSATTPPSCWITGVCQHSRTSHLTFLALHRGAMHACDFPHNYFHGIDFYLAVLTAILCSRSRVPQPNFSSRLHVAVSESAVPR